MADQLSNGKTNWNNLVQIIVALVGAGGIVAAAVLPVYIQKDKSKGIRIDSLIEVIESKNLRIQMLESQLEKAKTSINPVFTETEPAKPESVLGKLDVATFGEYKIEPTNGLTASTTDGTITFAFNVSNIRRDKLVSLYTRNAVLQGENYLTQDGVSAQLSNSKIAGPQGYTSMVKLIQSIPLKAYIKFKTEEKISKANAISFYIDTQEITYTGNFPITWDE